MSGGGGEQTVGYKYYSGDRLLLGHDTFDKVVKIRWAGKVAWEGSVEFDPDNPASPGQIKIDKKKLFGGESREGGVSGTMDVLFGHSSQPIHDYLLSKINSVFLPAYRGVTSLVMRHFYVGNNPYIKELGITAQRIHRVGDGELQWYDEKSEVGTTTFQYGDAISVLFALDNSISMQTNNRIGLLKTAVIDTLNLLSSVTASAGLRLDIGLVKFGASGAAESEFRYAVTATDIAILIDFVNSFDATWSGTDFESALLESLPFFDQVPLYGVRKFFFITDGSPQPAGSDDDAATLAADWLDKSSGDFSDKLGSAIDMHGINIDLSSVTHTQKLDNTSIDGVPVVSSSDSDALKNAIQAAFYIGSYGDMNPAHMIREWLTHPEWGRGLPGSMIGDSYYDVADQLYAEGMGLSFYWSQEITYRDAINEIQRHIDAVRYVDPNTGKLEIKLIRGDYDPNNLPVLDNSNSKVVRFDRKPRSELYNQITVKYKDRDSGNWKTLTVRDDTAIRRLGRTRNKTFEYPGIWRSEVALMVARRDIAANSREFSRATIKTNRRVMNLKPGDVFTLSDQKNGISGMVCRVAQRTDTAAVSGEITLEVAEDVFGDGWSLYSQPTSSRWTDPIGTPQDFEQATGFEKPYIMTVADIGDSYINQIPQDVCYYAFAGARPATGGHINYNLYVYPEGEEQRADYEFAITGEFTPIAIVQGDILDRLETNIPVSGIDNVETLRAGHLVLIGDATDDKREIAALAVDVSEDDLHVTLTRGVADTMPCEILDGTVLYFIGDQYAGDSKEFISGEVVESFGTPVNGSGVFLGPYTYHGVEMRGRFTLPYPPADVQINSLYFPETHIGDLAITWAERNRIIQSDQIVGFTDPSVTPEGGTTYTATLLGEDEEVISQQSGLTETNWGYTEAAEFALGLTTDSHTGVFEYSGTLPGPIARLNSTLTLQLNSQRDGNDSLQSFEHTLIRDGYGYSYGKNYGGH